jgi:hypothetical protein
LSADNLQSVSGDLYIDSNAKLSADNLRSVGGYLHIGSNVKLSADNLRSVGGDLYIDSNAKLSSLQSVGGYLYIDSNAKLSADNLRSVGGYLHIGSNVKLSADNLRSVGGYLYIGGSNVKLSSLQSVGGHIRIYSRIDLKLEKQLYRWNPDHKFILNDKCSEWLLNQKGNLYKIGNTIFDKVLFDKVRKNELMAKEVFQIQNTEQRRIAYERLDKLKLKELKNLKTLDKVKDEYGNSMKVVEFTVENIAEPFRFLNCICPSSGREYFIETQSVKCKEAKAKSFGFDKIKFEEEW